jgi:hypothetical protein
LCGGGAAVDLCGHGDNTMKMKIAQPILAASALLAVVASTARADAEHAGAEPVQLDAATVPEACRPYLAVPSDAKSELMVWNQRMSLAACLIDTTAALPSASEPGQLRALVGGLEDSVQRSTAIYRDAMAHAPLPIQMVAAYGLGSVSRNLVVRARAAIAPSTDPLRRALEPLLAGHAHDAAAAFAEVDRLAKQSPASVSRNPVLTSIVTAARSELAALGVH